MSEKRLTGDEVTSTQARENQVIFDVVQDNALRMVEEVAKAQPQFAYSISQLQLDYIETAKSLIESSFVAQKQFLSTPNLQQFKQQQVLLPSPERVAEQYAEFTNNALRSVGIFSALGVNMLDAARENLKLYSRTMDTAIQYNTNSVKTWAYYWTASGQ
jgi:hypothetical protein